MRQFGRRFGALLVLLLILCDACSRQREGSQQSRGVTIVFMGEGPCNEQESLTDERVFSDFKRRTGINVKYIPGPESATDRLQLYLKFIASKSSPPNVYFIDVV
jgi:hypothetical protein